MTIPLPEPLRYQGESVITHKMLNAAYGDRSMFFYDLYDAFQCLQANPGARLYPISNYCPCDFRLDKATNILELKPGAQKYTEGFLITPISRRARLKTW